MQVAAFTTFHEYFIPIFGAGLAVAIVVSILAGLARGVFVPAILLVIGVLAFWAGLFFGSVIGYRQWQAIPNPPEEAFADTMPLGALIAGWFPGICCCGLVFGAAKIFRSLFWPEKVKPISLVPPESVEVVNLNSESTNPYQSPNVNR